jgi:hypothetical protein
MAKQRYYAKDKVVTNYCSIKGSIELAKRIEAYWAERGAKTTCSMTIDHVPNSYAVVGGVRSNMRNGLPVKWDKPDHVHAYVLNQMFGDPIMPTMVIRRYETDEFLKSFDADAHAPGVPYPTGYAEWTYKLDEAMVFGNASEAIAFYRTQSKATPFRPDGKPNLPLTVFSVAFDTMQYAQSLADALKKANSDASRNA